MKPLRNTLIVILLTLLLLEGVLQVCRHAGDKVVHLMQRIDFLSDPNPFVSHRDSVYWKRRFVDFYEGNIFKNGELMHGTHVPHKTRGWTPKPHISIVRDGYRYTTNNLGHRALRDYAYDKNQYQILIVGDSYTFGIDADDLCVWPNMLQAVDDRLNVINLAVGGYGIDQMLITLEETIRFYQPDLVIAAFVREDMWRALLDFRDYKKPRFKIEENGLILTNTPIGGVDEVYLEAIRDLNQQTFDLKYIRTDNLLRNLIAAIADRPLGHASHEKRLLAMLLKQMCDTAKGAGADFLAVYLATGPEMENDNYRGPEETLFLDFVRECGVRHINTREFFLRAEGHYAKGHYRAAEAALVSTLVYGKIQSITSFQEFVHAGEEIGEP